MPPDEPNHFYRAFELSCGKLVSEHIGENGVGGNYLPYFMQEDLQML